MKRSKVAQLPRELREWLDARLIQNNFSSYARLTLELRERAAKLGIPADFSSGGVHRYGANLERKLSSVKAGTQAALMLAQWAPDDADLRSAALVNLILEQISRALVDFPEVAKAGSSKWRKALYQLAGAVPALTRASLNQKKHAMETMARAKAAAKKIARVASKEGLSPEIAEEIRREILKIGA